MKKHYKLTLFSKIIITITIIVISIITLNEDTKKAIDECKKQGYNINYCINKLSI